MGLVFSSLASIELGLAVFIGVISGLYRACIGDYYRDYKSYVGVILGKWKIKMETTI